MKYPYRDYTGKFASAIVNNLPKESRYVHLVYVSDSQDVDSIKDYLDDKAQEFDSFFVVVDNGDYAAVWGMYGIVPFLSKPVHRIV